MWTFNSKWHKTHTSLFWVHCVTNSWRKMTKKYHLFDIQNIISLLLLHINYFYCRPESMVWRGLLKMSMCYSLGLQPVMPWKVVTSLGERPTGKKMISARMSFGRDYGTPALSLCLFAAWLCWDEQLSLLNAPIKMFYLVSEMKAAGRASMGKSLRTWIKINFSSLKLLTLDVL